MGQQIILQPNGKYALWSSISDDFIFLNASKDEIIEEIISFKRHSITTEVERVMKAIEKGQKPYHQFTKTFQDCIDTIKANHGEDAETLSILKSQL